jgi:hypothetical protein
MLDMLRELLDLPNLINLNAEKMNYPGVDLGDDVTGRAFQITADNKLPKILKTLKVSIGAKVHETYPRIQVYITTERQRSYKQATIDRAIDGKIAFDGKKDILDYKSLLRLFQQLSPEKAEKIARIARDYIRRPSVMASPELALALERDVASRLQSAIARNAFAEAVADNDLTALAEQAMKGAQLLSKILRHDVLIRAARSAALSKRVADADRFVDAAKAILDDPFVVAATALIVEARGEAEEALRLLRDRVEPDSVSTFIGILSRVKGNEVAFEWIASKSINIRELTAHGLLACIKVYLGTKRLEELRILLGDVPQGELAASPAALFFRGMIRLVSVFPKPYQFIGLSSVPLHLGFARPALLEAELSSRLDQAIGDLEYSLSLIRNLNLPRSLILADWYLTWANLMHPHRSGSAKQKLDADMQVMPKAVQEIQLAFRYLDAFDPAPLKDYLRRREVAGGLDDDDLLASLIIDTHTSDHAASAALLRKHRTRYEMILGSEQAALLEVLSLAQANDGVTARARLGEVRSLLGAPQIADLEAEIERAEGKDLVAAYIRAYESAKSTASLSALVSELSERKADALLGPYAETLFAQTEDPALLALAAGAYSRGDDTVNFFRLVEAHPGILSKHVDLKQRYAWALMKRGELQAATTIADEFRAAKTRDLALEINLAIESGEWEKLASPLAAYLDEKERHDARTLIHAAQTALVSSYGPYRELVAAALGKKDVSAEVYLVAYSIGVESDLEDKDAAVSGWFRSAVELAGPDGPVQKVEMKELLDKQIEWSRHSRQVNDALMSGSVPLIVAAPQLHTTMVEALLGNFVRNVDEKDTRKRTLVPLFSGRRVPLRIETSKRIALDITTILVMGYLELLPKLFKTFEHFVIPAGVMRELFDGQRQVRQFQRSQLKRASQLRGLIGPRIKVVPSLEVPTELSEFVGGDLTSLLQAARGSGGVVVRPAPVFSLGSHGKDIADLSAYSDCLCDTQSLLTALKNMGAVDRSTEELAATYFRAQDQGWPASTQPQRNRPLYLDDVAISYLQTTKLLGKVIDNFEEVFVSVASAERAAEFINIDERSSEVVEVIRAIREEIAKTHNAGRLTFGEPKAAAEEGDENNLSTIHLLSNLTGVDTVAIDDRSLNKDGVISVTDSVAIRVATTLDILEELRLRDAITEDEWLELRHRLRSMGASLIDVHPLEVRKGAERSSQSESSEFREIRNSISLARVRKVPRFPAEIPWLISINLALRTAIKEIWNREPDKARAATLGELILSAIPRPDDWVAFWEPGAPPNWVRATNRSIYSSLVFAVDIDDSSVRTQYFDWINRTVLKEIEVTDPDMYREIVDQLKMVVDNTVDKSHE